VASFSGHSLSPHHVRCSDVTELGASVDCSSVEVAARALLQVKTLTHKHKTS